ncbi:MAG: hypothetical protein M0Z52_01775 [Actinomycetota bacterium]|nr:hypothetical protein [Actinomycetota bacterium]
MGEGSQLIGDNNGQYSVSNIVINGLQFQDIGSPGDGSGTAINFLGSGSSIEVKNCIIAPHAIQAFAYANANNQKNADAIYFHDNQISYSGREVVYGYQGYTLNDVEIYNNRVEGPGLTLANDLYAGPSNYHIDGFMVENPGVSTTTPTITNVLFYNNLFYGAWDWCTSEYYTDGGVQNLSIYNNVFSIEQTATNSGNPPMYAFVRLNQNDYGTINVYNNTFSTDSLIGNPGVEIGFWFVNPDTAKPVAINIKNNIYSGGLTGNSLGTASNTWTSLNIDHNLYNLTTYQGGNGNLDLLNNGPNWTSPAQACAGGGYDCNSFGGNDYSSTYPGFVSLPNGTVGSGNWQVQAGSPAIGSGANLSNIFTYDITNATRPSTGGWTMGAYEYNASPTSSTTYTVTPSAGSGGSISPATPQTVSSNATTSFTVTPATGYNISSVTGCGGTLSGNTYTTGPVTANCTVTAAFAINTYTVTPSAGSGGTISPATPQSVNYDAAKSFTVTPATGYGISSVTGCGGTLSGNTYTTGPVTANCTVTASFSSTPTGGSTGGTTTTYTVTPSAGSGGSISPSTPQTVDNDAATSFTVTPATGYGISSVTGCGGSLSGNTYTTGPITANCAVTASFSSTTSSTSTSPQLVSPSNGQTTSTTVTFTWTKPGNKIGHYKLLYSQNSNLSSSSTKLIASSQQKPSVFAGLGMGLLPFGIILPMGIMLADKKKRLLLVAALLIAAAALSSCGAGGGATPAGGSAPSGSTQSYTVSGLTSNTTYYWAVQALDSNGQVISQSTTGYFQTQ